MFSVLSLIFTKIYIFFMWYCYRKQIQNIFVQQINCEGIIEPWLWKWRTESRGREKSKMDLSRRRSDANRFKLTMSFFCKHSKVNVFLIYLVKNYWWIFVARAHTNLQIPEDKEPHLPNIPQQESHLHEEEDVEKSRRPEEFQNWLVAGQENQGGQWDVRHQPGELHDPHIPGLLRPEGEDQLLRESQTGVVVSKALSQEEKRVC